MLGLQQNSPDECPYTSFTNCVIAMIASYVNELLEACSCPKKVCNIKTALAEPLRMKDLNELDNAWYWKFPETQSRDQYGSRRKHTPRQYLLALEWTQRYAVTHRWRPALISGAQVAMKFMSLARSHSLSHLSEGWYSFEYSFRCVSLSKVCREASRNAMAGCEAGDSLICQNERLWDQK